MADDFKGADWLSLSDEIRNPYFGDQMLRCGEVTKQIKY
jgi:Cu(I)/Ag(I) efflux system membrane fusion protein